MKTQHGLFAVVAVAFVAAIIYEVMKAKRAGQAITPQALQRPVFSSAPTQGTQNNPTPQVTLPVGFFTGASSAPTPKADTLANLPLFTMSPTYRVDALFGSGDTVSASPPNSIYFSGAGTPAAYPPIFAAPTPTPAPSAFTPESPLPYAVPQGIPPEYSAMIPPQYASQIYYM